jgi:predicted transcriptional regulator of viral defense system
MTATNANVGRVTQAREAFRRHGGILRTRDAISLGVHPEVIYFMRDAGILERVARGLYRLADGPELSRPDLVAVSLKAPKAVICMVSALAYHGITTQIPHAVDISLPRGAERPRIDHPPIHVYWAVERIHGCGVEEHQVDGMTVRVYSPEKTLVDCFRYRNKIGLDTGVEALKLYRERKPVKADAIMDCARACRVARTILPYLEGIL